MDKIKKYRNILESITKEHSEMPSAVNSVRSIAVSDSEQNNFFLIDVDMRNKEHYVVFHLHLENEKILIEQDGIEYGIANDLIEAGIFPEDIVGVKTEETLESNKELLVA